MSTSISTGSLEPPGHARGRTPSREPEHEQHDQAAEDGEEQRVPVDDGEVEQSPRLVVLEVVEVVVDVLA
jgi:hypothetical protein